MIKVITSKDNSKIKKVASLKESKYRNQYQEFLGETLKSLQMAVAAHRVKEVFTQEYLNIPDDIPQILVSEEVLKKISSNVNPEGVVFVASMLDQKVNDPHKVLFLDEITDPGNMGTLIRTALAFNYDQVVVSKNCVSIYNPKVVNSTKGAIFSIPIRTGELSEFKDTHQIIASSLGNNSIPLDDLKVEDRFVLVLGNESHGVSAQTKKLANQEVIIPIQNIDSLNVAVAGGILMNKIH